MHHPRSRGVLAPAQVAAGLGLEAGSYSPATIHRAENTDDVDRLRLVRDSPAGVNHPVALLAHPRLVARCAEHESEPADRGALRARPLPAYPGWRRLVLMLAAEPLWA